MATSPADDETTISIDFPEMVSIKLANHDKEYWIEKAKLLEVSAYFRGMFAWEFQESASNQIVFHDMGDNIEQVFDIFIRFLTRESYSIEQYIVESTEVGKRFTWMQVAVFALFMHELWLDVFILVNKYALEKAYKQVVRDITELVAIFLSGSTISKHKPFWAIHPINIHSSYFRQVHYNRVKARFGNSYPTHFQDLFADAMRAFYAGNVNIQDTTFIDMARETPHLAIHVLPDWGKYIATNEKPDKVMKITNRMLYELMERIVLANVEQAEDTSKEAKMREWPAWFNRQ